VTGSYPVIANGTAGWNGWYMLGQKGDFSLTMHKTDDDRVETGLANIRSDTPVDIIVKKSDGSTLGSMNDTFRCKIADPGLSKDPESSIMAAFTGPVAMSPNGNTVARTFSTTDGADRSL
ncbi:hypothetical protein LCGC14_1925610, partial [marine sediment metagenome]